MMLSRGLSGFMAALLISVGTLLAPDTSRAQTFSDGTAALDLPNSEGPAAWGDFDRDGWVDLLIGDPVFGHQVWRNVNGTGFTLAFTLSLNYVDDDYDIWGDYDNDGYLDVASREATTLRIYHNDAGAGFTSIPVPPLPMAVSKAVAWGDFDGDGNIDLYVGGYENAQLHGLPDAILTNRRDILGNPYFEKTWEEPDPQGPEKIKQGRGVTACDFDRDGDLDIHVSNYRLEEDYLWRNDGTGVFTDAAGATGLNVIPKGTSHGHTIGSAWGDLDNDGEFDLFEGNFSHYSTQKPPSFYRNLGLAGGYLFANMTTGAGLAWQENYDTPALGDYDNDGDLDLFYTTVSNADGNHPVLYSNDLNAPPGAWHFTDVTTQAGLAGLTATEQAAWADFDRDGDLDLITDERVWVNSGTSNYWLEVNLRGENGVGNTIGSQVRITGASGVPGTLSRQVEAGTGQANQNEMTLHFGLGNSSGPVDLEVTWPDGTVCQVPDVEVDGLMWVIYPCCPDSDGDGVCDGDDNCPQAWNANQFDQDADGVGNACDNCPAVSNTNQADLDGDQDGDVCDNCPEEWNPNQADLDGDQDGDVCDNCPGHWNPTQADSDSDGTGDACEGLFEICDPYCANEGIRCVHSYFGPGGCCAYSCGPNPICQGPDPLPPNICGGN